MQKISGTPAFAINPTYREGMATPHETHPGWSDISTLLSPVGDPVGGAPVANYPGRYAQIGGSAATPGGQPLDFAPSVPGDASLSVPASSGSTSGSSGTSGSTDPLTTVADAFMAALGSGGGSASGGSPTILYPSAQVDDTTGGSTMNVKAIAIAAAIIVAAWFAWKKWGKPAAA